MDVVEFLQDKGQGNKLSATRLAMLLWALSVLVVWIVISVRTNVPASIPESVVTILGIVLGGKAIQRFGEKPVARGQAGSGRTKGHGREV